MSERRLIPSITTHSKTGSTWREKLAEIIPLGIAEVGLFVTGLSKDQRKECYRLLCYFRDHHSFTIPFVHAVSDMDDDEYAFLRGSFKTEWFNLHPLREFPLLCALSDETRSRVLIENSCFVDPLSVSDLQGFAGLCIDLAHLEDARLAAPGCYAENIAICQKFPVHANHLSGVALAPHRTHKSKPAHSIHTIEHASELNYLSGTPSLVWSGLVALELENSLSGQLKIIKHIESLSTQIKDQKIAA